MSKKISLIIRSLIYCTLFGIIIYELANQTPNGGYGEINENPGTYMDLIFSAVLLLLIVIDWGTFFDKNANRFLQNTKFLENIKEKTKQNMFFSVIGISFFLFLWSFCYEVNWILFIPGSFILYFSLSKVIQSWKFKHYEWFSSFYEKFTYSLFLFLGSAAIVHLISRSMLFGQYIDEIVVFLAFGGFWVFLIWGIFSFFDRYAIRYETSFSEFFYSQSKDQRKICAHCQCELDDTVIRALSIQDSVFCVQCGGKIMKHEIFQPSEEEILRDHQKAINIISNHIGREEKEYSDSMM